MFDKVVSHGILFNKEYWPYICILKFLRMIHMNYNNTDLFIDLVPYRTTDVSAPVTGEDLTDLFGQNKRIDNISRKDHNTFHIVWKPDVVNWIYRTFNADNYSLDDDIFNGWICVGCINDPYNNNIIYVIRKLVS